MSGVSRPPVAYRPDGGVARAVDEVDLEYQRSVQEIEGGQHQPGWLFGKGAFDKTDLLFIRDHELQQRHREEQVADAEALEFAALRARLDDDAGAVATSTVAATIATAPAAVRVPNKRERVDSHKAPTPKQLLPVIIKRQRTSDSLDEHLAAAGPLSSRASVDSLKGGFSSGTLRHGTSDASGINGSLPGLGGYGSSSEDADDERVAGKAATLHQEPRQNLEGEKGAGDVDAPQRGTKAAQAITRQAQEDNAERASQAQRPATSAFPTRKMSSGGSGTLKLPSAAQLLGVVTEDAPQQVAAEATTPAQPDSRPESRGTADGSSASSSNSE